ncbi:MAG: FtsX-like permease family protein [Ardenticatenaceae bacterium]|nr:FtsX-like permease family protein [Ardenticatenaceae bacterium]
MKFKPRWIKVLRDLMFNKSRTALVVISIAVGVTAIGMVMGAQSVINEDLPRDFFAINPASAIVFTLTTFDDDAVQAIRDLPEVEEAQGRRTIVVPFRTPNGNWRNMQLYALPDFEDIRINQLKPQEGAWPPEEGEILIERSAFVPNLGFDGIDIGDSVTIKAPNGKEKTLRIVGTAHDLNQFPPQLAQSAFGYISFDTLDLLAEPREFNQLEFIVAENKLDEDHVKVVSDLVQDELEARGVSVVFVLAFPPGEPPFQSFIAGISTLLVVMGFLSLGLSGFLIINTLAAILTQQVRQIGIMKAVGGRTHQLVWMYFGMVVVFGLLAVIIAIPLGALGAGGLAGILGFFFNFDVRGFAINPQVVVVQVLISLLVPLLAAIYPIIRGTRTTVREAISDHSMGKGQFGTRPIDLFIVGLRRVIPGIKRPEQISLRNTFRRKGRLILTLMTLSLASVIFISILSIRASLQQTLDEALGYFDFDVQIRFSRPYRAERLTREGLGFDEVSEAEVWGFGGGRRVRPDGSESDNIIIQAPPADSVMIEPVMLEGRWIEPNDTNAIVINNDVLRNEDDLTVGSRVTLSINGRDSDWVVVGIARSSFPQPAIYTNAEYFSRATNLVGRGQAVLLKTTPETDLSQFSSIIETHYRDRGFRVEETQTVDQARSILTLFFNIPILFMLAMAVVLGIVGGLGLMGTMSINVIERLREIGVMRAIGASNWSVLWIVLLEGMVIGFLSWLIGGVVALPLSRVLTEQAGQLLLQSSPSYIFSVPGTIGWLVIVILLAVVASFLPARSASKVTVREVLSYE